MFMAIDVSIYKAISLIWVHTWCEGSSLSTVLVVESVSVLQSPELDAHYTTEGRAYYATRKLVLRDSSSEQVDIVHVTGKKNCIGKMFQVAKLQKIRNSAPLE